MGNLVPAGSTAVGAYTAGVNPWAEAARGIESGAYLKFNGNDGRWSFGQDDEDLPEKSRIVTDMETLALGWICWVDSSVEEEILVPVVEGKAPFETELPDHGPYDQDDGWREAASISAVLESYGTDDQDEAVGTQLLWKTSTGGQVRQIKKLSGAYGRVFSQHPGEYPVVELGAESYVPKVKKHGKIKWSPTLKIVGWMTAAELEGLSPVASEADDGFEEPAAPRKAAAAAPVEEDAPAPRRRAAAPVEEEEAAPAPRRRAAAPVEEEEAAPAPRRRAAAPVEEVVEDEEVVPAPRRRAAAPVEEVAEEEEAPAPRRRRAAPVEEAAEEEEEVVPAPRRRAVAPVEEEEIEDEAAPAPRGRSAGRGAPPANARVRRFD
jgi:hypothetical protein